MNKYIKTDLQDSIKLMRVAIMNALNDIENGEETRINLGPYISQPLLLECLQEAKWDIEFDSNEYIYYEVKTPSNKEVLITVEMGDCIISSSRRISSRHIKVTISMCLSSIQKVKVPRKFDIKNEEDLKVIVKKQIFLPSDALNLTGNGENWVIDDFTVV